MATADFDAILTAVREVLEDATGTLRTIGAAVYQGNLNASLSDEEMTLRALNKPLVESRIGAISRNDASPNIFGSLSLLDIEVVVRVVRHLDQAHELDDDIRDDVKALSAADGDVIMQALTFPGNLTQTSGSAATGLVSGMLSYEGSDPPDTQQEATGSIITTEHNFSGVVQVTLAVS